jgi:dTDP-glucose 4,6-dehydratase
MTTYLVTGGAGFIGSNFIHYLFQTYGNKIEVINLDLLTYAGNLMNLHDIEGYSNYHFIKGDICDTTLVSELMTMYEIDYVVHFAAESHVDRSIEDSKAFAQTNIMGTLNLLDCAKKSWVIEGGFKKGKKFLYISTDEVYGELGEEGYFTEETPLAPRNPYSASKASGEMMVEAYYKTHHFPTLRTRCTNNYGPYQFPEKVIPLFINHCIQNKKLPIYGDGLSIRDWLHVSDHCKAIDLVLSKGSLGSVYNIGDHTEKTTLEIAKIVIDTLNEEYQCNISSDYIDNVADRKGHDRRYAIDPAKIRTELGWTADIKFEDGIRETIAWYMRNLDFMEAIISGEYQNYYKQ